MDKWVDGCLDGLIYRWMDHGEMYVNSFLCRPTDTVIDK